jgi:TRAP-type C4-dicarboxylate transport system substrate-binding protein
MKIGRLDASLDPSTSSAEVHDMDGKQTLALGLVAVVSLVSACSSAPVAPQTGSPSSPQAGSPAPAPTGIDTKDGGVAQTSLKATLATVTNEGVDEHDLADTLRQASAGAIDIAVSSSWRQPDVNSETELIQDVAAGKAQLGIVGLRAFDTVGVTSFMGIQAPFAIDSFDLQAKVLASDWAQKLLDGTRPAGVVGIGYVQGPLRQPLGVTRDLTSTSSFNGAKFGIRPSKVSDMTLRALGATPVGWSDLTGLDGIEMDVPSISGNRYDMSAKSLTGNVVLWGRPSAFFANAAWFDALTTDQQQALRSAAAAVDQRTLDRVQSDAITTTDILCHRSVRVADVSSQAMEELRAKIQPVIDELEKDPGTKATIDAIAGLRGSTPPYAFGPCSEPAASGPAAGATALEGTWTTSYTKAELAASPLVDPSEVSDGNWGELALTFAGGKVTFTQRNPIGDSATSGTFTVKNDVLTMTFDQGGNAGETFGLRWSVYKNTLSFRRDDTVGIGPTPFLVKAWTKG